MGPSFGDKSYYDLQVWNGKERTGRLDLGYSFSCPEKAGKTTYFTGKSPFNITELEVFQIDVSQAHDFKWVFCYASRQFQVYSYYQSSFLQQRDSKNGFLDSFRFFLFYIADMYSPYRIKCNIKNVVTLKSSEEIFMRGDKAGSNDF